MLTRSVIIGGGLAGLGAALYAQQRGFIIPVYEKNSDLRCEDNLLWLAPNGLKLLEGLGLIDHVRARSCPQESMIFADKQLKTLMQMKGEALQTGLGFPIMAIKRAELYRLMLDAVLAAGGVVHFGHELQSIQQSTRGLTLRFNSQLELASDFVIAADGIGSLVRRQLMPQSRVHYQGLRTYLGRSRTPVAPKFVGKTIESWGQGTRFVLTSLDGETVYWSAIERAPDYVRNGAPLPAGLIAGLRTAFADYHPDIQAIIAAAVPASIHRCNFGVVQGLPQFANSRVGFIGDAAHGMPPNMGQGASLGLEDALHMVNLIAKADPDSGLPLRDDRPRVRRAQQMMRLANGMNTAFQPKSRWASALRNHIARCIPDRLNESRMLELYSLPSHLQEGSIPNRSPVL